MSGPKPLVAAALLALATTTLAAADVAIKLGTQAPTNSMWHKALLEMGSAWAKATEQTRDAAGLSRTAARATRRRPSARCAPAVGLAAGGSAHHRRSGRDRRRVQRARHAVLLRDRRRRAGGAEEARAAARAGAAGERVPPRRVGHGRLGAAVLEEAAPLARRCEGREALREQDRRPMVQWYTRNGFNPVPLLIADIAPQLKLPTGMIDTAPNTRVPRADDADLTAMRNTCSTCTSRRSWAR